MEQQSIPPAGQSPITSAGVIVGGQESPARKGRRLFVTTKPICNQVGRPASANRGSAVFKLTIKVKLSYKQAMRIIAFLLMLIAI